MPETEYRWPIPFGGIKCLIRFDDIDELKAAVRWLMGEGRTCQNHVHNFAVSVDGLALHTSGAAAELCINAFMEDYHNNDGMD